MRIHKVYLSVTRDEMMSIGVGAPEKIKSMVDSIKLMPWIDQNIDEITLQMADDSSFERRSDVQVLVEFIYHEVHRDVSDSDDDSGGGDPTSGSDAGVGEETD